MSTHNMFSSRDKKNIIWILFVARAMNYLSQDKYIEISYLSSGKWDKLDKSGMVFPQLWPKKWFHDQSPQKLWGQARIQTVCSATNYAMKPGPEVITLFSCSTQLSMKFHLVIKIKIPTIKTSFMLNSAEQLSMKEVLKNSQNFKINKQNKFHAQPSSAWKKFYNLGAWLPLIS